MELATETRKPYCYYIRYVGYFWGLIEIAIQIIACSTAAMGSPICY